ncbi:MAG: hypothetical protein KDE51_08375 [Anaerolineales bacterium]|nr:hypothetical protein [Anaerolineales bacterium]
MKTAISIPDPIFEAAEEAAQRLGMSRSELYTTAISRFLDSQNDQAITEMLNRVYTPETDSQLEPDLAALQFHSLPKDDWE